MKLFIDKTSKTTINTGKYNITPRIAVIDGKLFIHMACPGLSNTYPSILNIISCTK
ncbi:MAG: hypothetical protein Q4F97_07875 [Bacteroidales bacterium]|nr:hypothetical protein [Bacteroidales bacterium]